MRWRAILTLVLITGLAAVGGLLWWGVQPVNEEHRVLQVVARPGNRAEGFLVEPDGKGLKQQDLRGIAWAFGRGAVHYPDAPGEMFVFGGRAYVCGPGGEVRRAEVLVNTESALGLGREAGVSALLYLPEGDPVPLGAVLAQVGAGLKDPVAVVGVGRFAGVSIRPVDTSPMSRLSAWRQALSARSIGPKGLVFLAFRTGDVGPERRTQGEWQLYGLLTEELPATGPVVTAGEILGRAREAGPRTPTPVSTNSSAVELVLAVYDLDRIVLATDFIEPPLVEITAVDPTIVLDIRYAGKNNFAGRPVYAAPRAYLVLPEAERLARVNARLREQGFRLKVYDAYRPFSDHARLWELAPDKRYWADPAKGSRHSRAAAVDCTLVTLDGQAVEMPTDFDDFTPRAHRDYQGASAAALRHRAILEEAMAAEGFIPLPKEWWHFDSPVWWEYPLRDIPLALDGTG